MKGFFFLSGPVFSGGLLILFSLFLRVFRLALLFDRLKGCGDHFRASSIPPFRGLPASLIESPGDHQVLAALEEIKLKLSQFSKGYDVDPISTSLPC
jgi:hypothetical protein